MDSEQTAACILELLGTDAGKKVRILKETCTIGYGPTADVRIVGEGSTSCTIDCKTNTLSVTSGQVTCNGSSVTTETALTYPSVITVENTSFKLTKESESVFPAEAEAADDDTVAQVEGETIVDNELIVCYGREIPNEAAERASEHSGADSGEERASDDHTSGHSGEHSEESERTTTTEEDVSEMLNELIKMGPSLQLELNEDTDVLDGLVHMGKNINFQLFPSDEELEPEILSEDQSKDAEEDGEEDAEEEEDSDVDNDVEEGKEEAPGFRAVAAAELLAADQTLQPAAGTSRISIFDSIPYEGFGTPIPPLSESKLGSSQSSPAKSSPAARRAQPARPAHSDQLPVDEPAVAVPEVETKKRKLRAEPETESKKFKAEPARAPVRELTSGPVSELANEPLSPTPEKLVADEPTVTKSGNTTTDQSAPSITADVPPNAPPSEPPNEATSPAPVRRIRKASVSYQISEAKKQGLSSTKKRAKRTRKK